MVGDKIAKTDGSTAHTLRTEEMWWTFWIYEWLILDELICVLKYTLKSWHIIKDSNKMMKVKTKQNKAKSVKKKQKFGS